MATNVTRSVNLPSGGWLAEHAGKLILLSDIIFLLIAYLLALHGTDVLRSNIFAADQGDFYHDFMPERMLQLYVLGSGLCFWFALKGHYTERQSLTTEAANILAGIFVVALLDGYLQYALKQQPSRLWLATTWALAALFLIGGRVLLKHILFRMGPWRCPVLVVGSASAIADACRIIGHDRYIGQVVAERIVVRDLATFGDRLEAAVRAGTCRYILIAFDEHELGTAAAVARLVDDRLHIPYGIVPALNDISKSGLQLHTFFGNDMVVLHNSRATLDRRKQSYKRLFDLAGASGLLLLLGPFMLLLALLIRLDGGPALYGSPRIGREGRVFRALKFRSMVPNADRALCELLASDPGLRAEWESSFKLKRDPRITRAGRFLRRTSLDELPQLLNVLRGDMSLVGPRPLLLEERDRYTGRAFELYQSVTPGLTGMWQVSGRDDLEYYRRIELNNWYIKNWSPWIDTVILIKTVFIVLGRAGAS